MGKNLITNISRTILRTYGADGGMILKMSIGVESTGFDNVRNALYIKSQLSDEVSTHQINISTSPLLVLSPGGKDAYGKYGSNGSLFINQLNKKLVTDLMKKMWKLILSGKPFGLDGDNVILYAPEKGESYSISTKVGRSGSLTLSPIVVTYEGETYEGVRLLIGGEATIDLVVDEYKLLYDTLRKMDMFLYSQALLNFVAAYKSKFEPNIVNKTKSADKRNFFSIEDSRQAQTKDEESVTDTIKPPVVEEGGTGNTEEDDGLDGLGTAEPTA